MKKIVALSAFFFISAIAFAQLPSGTPAPDFTVTDINGNSHTLSSYIASGKKIILEFSGVTCGPCWKYHKTEAVEDFYNAYGPSGSNEAMVLFIEDATYTTLAELNGISNPPAFGNWVEGTPYPIILSSSVYNAYQIEYVPTIYRICGDGTLHLINQLSASGLKNTMSAYCGQLAGTPNYVKAVETVTGFCSNTGNFVAKVKNYGSNAVTSLALNLKANGTVVGTKNFTGSFATFETQEITFDAVTVNPAANYTVEVVSVNGVANHNPAFSAASMKFHTSVATGIPINIKIHTYSCPNHMSWNITNSAGAIVVSGGPYGDETSNICGGLLSNTIITQAAVLPNTDDCYSIQLKAAGGYGWMNYYGNAGETPAGIEIFSNNSLVYSKLNVNNFGSILDLKNVLTTTQTLGIGENDPENLKIYPIPTSGKLFINAASPVNVSIFDLSGKNVFNTANAGTKIELDLSGLQTGLYMAKIINQDGHASYRKIIIGQ